MTKKKARPDVERRVRQCERLARVLKLLHLIMGKGRWNADSLAEELGCSNRTVYRLLQSLSFAGVPWYLDQNLKAYRVRPGFKFAATELIDASEPSNSLEFNKAREKLLSDGERFSKSLEDFLSVLRNSTTNSIG